MKKKSLNDIIWVSFLSGLAVADVALLRNGHELLTTSARSHKVLTTVVLGAFALHVFDVLGPLDPFDIIGFLARSRRAVITISEELVIGE